MQTVKSESDDLTCYLNEALVCEQKRNAGMFRLR